MATCDYPSHKCSRVATAQLNIAADLLAEVVLYDTTSKLARFCQQHAEKMARTYNDRTVREQTQLHHLGQHTRGRVTACAYCTPDTQRRLRVVEAA